jgi:DNA-binding SARP family transcriptional activator/pimeloyl-ACP methyl ester carboxylesterase
VLVRVLGAVELVGDGGAAVPLPGSRQPALLAALAARAGEVVSRDKLIDLLWGDDLPERPDASLHSAVFKLRTSLRSACGRNVLVTRDRGYQLALAPGDLDAEAFTRLVREARDQAPAEAADTLASALDLWRGSAYFGFADTDVAQLEALRLEEARRTAVERLGDALLAGGRPADAVLLLEPFVADQPLREGARATLMRALHRQGRTSEALDHYQAYRRHIGEELGIEPSPTMQALQVELLRQPDPAPALTGQGTGPAHPPPDPGGSSSSPRANDARRPEVAAHGLSGLQVGYLRTEEGNVLAYGSTGRGPRLVVLLGWVSSLDLIASGRDPRSSLLERLTNDVTVTLYDRAGTGLSPGPVADYGFEASVDELTEIVRAVGPPVSLLAMSAAGPIAVAMAARRPDWVSSLVLSGTFSNGPATFRDKALQQMFVEISRTHWGLGSKMLADLYRPGVSDAAAWHLARVFRDSASSEVAAGYLNAMYAYDVTDRLSAVEAPALLLHYRSDRLVPFRGSQDLAAGLPHARLLALDGRYHLPDAADLDLVQRAIARHITQNVAHEVSHTVGREVEHEAAQQSERQTAEHA